LFLLLKSLSKQRTSWLLLALTAIMLELCALFFQYVMNFHPCVMCVYERLAVLGIMFAGLIGAIQPKNVVIHFIALLVWAISAIWGLIMTLEHVGLQLHPSPYSTCNFLPNFPAWAPLHLWFPWLFKPSGDCSQVVWTLLGYSMVQWLIVAFVVYCISLLIVIIAAILPKQA